MRTFSNYFWLLVSLLLTIHGAIVILDEWGRKSIHDGETVEVRIDELNCTAGTMTFHFEQTVFKKKIDARTCVVFNVGQAIKLKHSQHYPDEFLFINEQSPARFILGALEIALGLIGLLANWPRAQTKRSVYKRFQHLSDN